MMDYGREMEEKKERKKEKKKIKSYSNNI